MSTEEPVRDSEEPVAGVIVRDLRKEYEDGEITAVDGINLDIEEGEFLVLLGPSGCGKTTTLRMIAGLEMVTEGEIRILGEEMTEIDPQNRGLSMVFQNYALYPHKSVRENLLFPLNKMDLTDRERNQQVIEAAELLEIEDLLEKKPKQLSGGQRQRVAVGRTIVREPKVFLMDEPLSNLDAKLRVKARADIRELQQRLETTTIYVTHDQEEAMSIADRIVIMNRGRIEQVGSPQEVYSNPTNEFVAGFLGEPMMNFLDVTVTDDGLVLFPSEEPVQIAGAVPDGVVRVGIRPEDIYLQREVEQRDRSDLSLSRPMSFHLDVREPLGHANEFSLSKEDITVQALIENCPSWVTEDITVEMTIDTSQLYMFDSTGAAF